MSQAAVPSAIPVPPVGRTGIQAIRMAYAVRVSHEGYVRCFGCGVVGTARSVVRAVVVLDQGIGGMVVNGFEILRLDRERVDALVLA